jgi:dTDP-glucose 4,6-dehydratase
VRALRTVAESGTAGESYLIGSTSERTNMDVVNTICHILDERLPSPTLMSYGDLIQFVEDRPGHDLRYAIDAAKIRADLGWSPSRTFEDGIRETVDWYLANRGWWQHLRPDIDLKRRGLITTQDIAMMEIPRPDIEQDLRL